MYLKTLKIWNFRKYGKGDGEFASSLPGLVVKFREGLNVLIGENDSGKTTVIDAIRYVLRTQSGEFIPIEEKDFHYQDGVRAEEMKIECTFDGLTEQDQGHFLEWLTLEDEKFVLRVWMYAKRQDNAVFPEFYAGAGDGATMEGSARMLLRTVYLKPLRDALTDMTHGYKSRFAQILGAHSLFKTQKGADGQPIKHSLVTKYERLKQDIEDYFKGEEEGFSISKGINDLLREHFLFDQREAEIKLAGGELSDILHQLDLILEGNKSGLGTLNLLCIAAEMLMIEQQMKGLKLVMIEELEAHLHPQYQMNVIDYIKSVVEKDKTQFILSTHSITIGSKLPLESLIVFRGDKVYPMGHEYTKLAQSDYSFLERFLDATKANMFFARGVIIVEGDAEELLLPAIAEAIDRPLNKYGVSIVNVGSTAYKRYAKIFQRKDGQMFDMPVSIVTDMDIPVMAYYNEENRQRNKQIAWGKGQIFSRIKTSVQGIPVEGRAEYFMYKEDVRKYFEMRNCQVPELEDVLALLTNDSKEEVSSEMLDSLRTNKRETLEYEYDKGCTKIYLPEKWTLEYEIAKSSIAKMLSFAIELAKMDERNAIRDLHEASDVARQKIKEIWGDKEDATDELAYEIFKSFTDKKVSKAITAQYMARLIDVKVNKSQEDKKSMQGILLKDPYLRYLVNAICHVTKPIEGLDE